MAAKIPAGNCRKINGPRVARRYRICENLFGFATTVLAPKLRDESLRLVFLINLAISKKALGDAKGMAECLASENWEKTEPRFQLAEAVLQERYHQSIKLMRSVGPNVQKSNYRNWPLFKDIHELPEFRSAFKEIFGEELKTPERPEVEVKDERVDVTTEAGSTQGNGGDVSTILQ